LQRQQQYGRRTHLDSDRIGWQTDGQPVTLSRTLEGSALACMYHQRIHSLPNTDERGLVELAYVDARDRQTDADRRRHAAKRRTVKRRDMTELTRQPSNDGMRRWRRRRCRPLPKESSCRRSRVFISRHRSPIDARCPDVGLLPRQPLARRTTISGLQDSAGCLSLAGGEERERVRRLPASVCLVDGRIFRVCRSAIRRSTSASRRSAVVTSPHRARHRHEFARTRSGSFPVPSSTYRQTDWWQGSVDDSASWAARARACVAHTTKLQESSQINVHRQRQQHAAESSLIY
jgi:hypothetical protein